MTAPDPTTPEQQNPDPDVVELLMEFEDGNLDEDQVVVLFQRLVDTGMINHLQGSYGRTAERLIAEGLVTLPR